MDSLCLCLEAVDPGVATTAVCSVPVHDGGHVVGLWPNCLVVCSVGEAVDGVAGC